jgi:hypothetical protein
MLTHALEARRRFSGRTRNEIFVKRRSKHLNAGALGHSPETPQQSASFEFWKETAQRLPACGKLREPGGSHHPRIPRLNDQ